MSNRRSRKPAITVCQTDFDRLSSLAEALHARNPAVAEELLGELDRARIVDDAKLKPYTARIGSTLHYSTDTGDERNVTLVLPKDADISKGYVSILTPIGVALLGLAPGQSIDWTSTHGERHKLTVNRVSQEQAQDQTQDARPA
ncbi:nucleoside diphosphate kinase regulator [Henriciella pelagia]|jgi:regulator of nucleoside diphosphate kinase|uniref:Nucleoside diphosphate kinase regulator n=1 Tax=Henriciella pelagia TaxID=1977912 RepID=A0ABQ1JWI3_9PROT|nr:nucleoside diphosphate kinase regulator [Henriciella pelagia]GGB80009.1 nucleoside diphosphate kinase regulator [Henriciella pelagia]